MLWLLMLVVSMSWTTNAFTMHVVTIISLQNNRFGHQALPSDSLRPMESNNGIPSANTQCTPQVVTGIMIIINDDTSKLGCNGVY